LAAILAADVVGYSRLMAADEAGTHARLKTLRKEFVEPKVAEHRGRVVKLTGDGALVEFPSVLDAVACAVEVQRGMAERNVEVAPDSQILFRVGSTSAMSSSTRKTSTAMASTSPRGWKPSPSPAASASQARSTRR
jgi:class 3 adenylate cyclase